MNKLLLVSIFFSVVTLGAAQTPVTTVEANNSVCEVNAAAIDNVANLLRSGNDRLFVIARLGNGESSAALNRRRLWNVRAYFMTNWKPDPAWKIDDTRMTFAAGSKVTGQGRVEFYVGSTLWLVSYVKRGQDICVDCCDYPDLRYYGMGKRDRPKRRNR